MIYTSLFVVALAGAATAFTPPGFEPASTNNLTVAFGNVLAVNGVDIPKADTASAPTIGTTTKLEGTYTIMMVDPDIPPAVAGGATSELLHWMQPGLVSSNTSTTIAGQKIFELINLTNVTAFSTYIQPSPPNKSPISHRYTQLLLNTTSNSSSLAILKQFAATRTNFSAVNVVKSAGLTVLMGNSFNVTAATNTTAAGGNSTSTAKGGATSTLTSTSTKAAASATGKTTGTATSSGGVVSSTGGAGRVSGGGGAVFAALGGLAAAAVLIL